LNRFQCYCMHSKANAQNELRPCHQQLATRQKMHTNAMATKAIIKHIIKNIRDSILYSFHRKRHALKYIRKIVFVCKGNICRSAFAEHLMIVETKIKSLSIESGGLNVDMRTQSPKEAINTAKAFGVDLDVHLSKGLEYCDLENADLILAMEFWQYKKLCQLYPGKVENIMLLREFTPFPENLICNIDDPYGQSERAFRSCFMQIKRAVRNIDKIAAQRT
jgi:protein-tyrosine phosphatase